ncbi:MAG: hypothetical protein ACT4N8_08095 [Sphingosinicella sp.]|uniref:hypothetical protein n=1 Tax=Sphingosinicella sp. TaxID=1917971 RepID=UPI004037F26C
MTGIRAICFAMLAVYSMWLIGLEMGGSQAQVRPYFSDIEGAVTLFAVNTTLSVALLAGTALLLMFAATADAPKRHGSRRFLVSLAALFALLAADDRFQVHERLGWRLGIPDHYVLVAWGLAGLALLAAYCRPVLVSPRAAVLFAAGAALFGASFAIDAFAASDAWLRLSLEDLAKSWGAAMFFAFGWESARFHLAPEPASKSLETAIAVWLPGANGARAASPPSAADDIPGHVR